MKTRRILWLYCVFASVLLAAWMIAIVAGSGRLRAASDSASESVQQATELADAQREVVTLMEEQQRESRADMSPQDAIRVSADVQVEQEQLAALDAARATAEAQYESASSAYQAHMKRLIPIIALLILHLVGSMLFWPRKDERLSGPLQ